MDTDVDMASLILTTSLMWIWTEQAGPLSEARQEHLKEVEKTLMDTFEQMDDASNGESAATGMILNSWLMHEFTVEKPIKRPVPARENPPKRSAPASEPREPHYPLRKRRTTQYIDHYAYISDSDFTDDDEVLNPDEKV